MTSAVRCGRCLQPVPPGFRLSGGDARCGRHVIQHPAVWQRSVVTALLVGTLLTAINQGNLILYHGFTGEILLKMILTFCVPFCVSTSGALGAARMRGTSQRRRASDRFVASYCRRRSANRRIPTWSAGH